MPPSNCEHNTTGKTVNEHPPIHLRRMGMGRCPKYPKCLGGEFPATRSCFWEGCQSLLNDHFHVCCWQTRTLAGEFRPRFKGLQRIHVVNHPNTLSKNQSQEPGTSKFIGRGHFDLILTTLISRKAVKYDVKVMKHSEEVTTCHHQKFRRLVLLGLNMIERMSEC